MHYVESCRPIFRPISVFCKIGTTNIWGGALIVRKICFKRHVQHVGPINVRGPAILHHVLFECRVKLTAHVIRSVFQSLKISNVISETGSLRVIHYKL